jgi:DNA primase catalytic core
MQVSKEGIERVKAANELCAVLAERGVGLRKKGRVLVARCPFHDEKTPSFTVTPSKGLFHCFGCGAAGDVIGFLTKHDKLSFREALDVLARRAGLDLAKVMEDRPRAARPTPPALASSPEPKAAVIPPAVVEHYHRTFCERDDAQAYLVQRGITDTDLVQALKVGYADGTLLKVIPESSELRRQLREIGLITAEGRELLGGCLVVPIPDPLTGQWVNLYGRGLRTPRHCYLPGPFRGVLNYQAARLSSGVVLTESVLDAISFHQAGVAIAIPIWGTNGFTADHLDTLKREGVKRVILALDSDEPGQKATDALKGKLEAAGIAVRVARLPEGIKDANELLVSRNGDATEAFRQLLDAAEPRPPLVPTPVPVSPPLSETPPAPVPSSDGPLTLARDGLTYSARVHSTVLGRLRATVKVTRGEALHVDTLDLYASRSRAEFARRVSKAFGVDTDEVESALLALVVEAEKAAEKETEDKTTSPPAMTAPEREEALAFLRRHDLLDQVAQDVDALGYVGEETNKRLLYLVAVSRKLDDPLSAIVLSQSGAGKSGLTEAIERLCPPEDVVLLTRLTPQSLYYTEPGFLDRKLVIVEERYGSMEADYSIRVLQSRKKLIAAAPVKDPQSGNMRTKVFTVEARAAFIEATTASSVNHENATRCFELQMDETEEQTRRIHERQRLIRTGRGLAMRRQADEVTRRHWNAQRLLETLPVVIPFADRLSFPSSWMRTRRDHARFLNLIEVSAFLHQHQRERSPDGAIVASLADYEAAYALAGEVLKETLTDVKRPLREAYQRIQRLTREKGGSVSRREIREALRVPDSTVRRWLQDLVDYEYLGLAQAEGERNGQGRAVRYRLLDREPQENDVAGLLTPAELGALLERRR